MSDFIHITSVFRFGSQVGCRLSHTLLQFGTLHYKRFVSSGISMGSI